MAVIAELCARQDPEIGAALAAFRCSGVYLDDENPPDGILPCEGRGPPQIPKYGDTVNGVYLPQNVIDQLKQLGISLAWYTQTELEDAVEACAVDGVLIDDNKGIHFRDKLQMSEQMYEDEFGERHESPYRMNLLELKPWAQSPEARYRERIKREREMRKYLIADDEVYNGWSLSKPS